MELPDWSFSFVAKKCASPSGHRGPPVFKGEAYVLRMFIKRPGNSKFFVTLKCGLAATSELSLLSLRFSDGDLFERRLRT